MQNSFEKCKQIEADGMKHIIPFLQEYVVEMLNPKYGAKLTLEAAQSLAMELVSCFPGNLRENIKE